MQESLQEQEAQALARRFHEAYERLAPDFGYTTRPETRAFDPQSANGRLMVAVCQELLGTASAAHDPAIEAKARNLYERWKGIPGWVPWVDGGNSHKQEEARRIVAIG